jgi:acylphosphatase
VTCARFIITGKVQGVFFRASTRECAVRLGLTGHAKNLVNGNVEVAASGSREAVDELDAWLHHGPPAAQVECVLREALPEQSWRGFTTA